MRIREMEDISDFGRSRRIVSMRHLLGSFKGVLSLAGVGLLCVTFFYLGSANHSNKFESHEIETLKSLINSLSTEQREKREVVQVKQKEDVPLVKRLKKRSSEDQPIAITRSFNGGVTYTRWGRRDCPKGIDTSRVYTGIAAGSHYTHTGGGSNLLCLSYNVTYEDGKFVDGYQDSSYIYGVEYRGASGLYGLWDFTDTEGANFNQHAVPCAVCMASARLNQLMIPGSDKCPSGWIKEYTGFIMGSAHSHKHTTDYVCIDDTPQVVPGSGGDQAGALLYNVETSCPSLQCEPYVNARELRCVVCTI